MIALVFFLLQAHAADCSGRISAYNEYEEKVNGLIVTKHSVFAPDEWSEHSAFEGLLVKAGDDADELVLEFKKDAKAKKAEAMQTAVLKPWPRDPVYKTAEGLKPLELLRERKGIYVIRLKKAGQVLCESKHAVVQSD